MTAQRVIQALRGLRPQDHERIPPPPQVWDRIAAAVGVDDVEDTADGATVTAIRPRPRWLRPVVVAASLLLVAVMAAGILWPRADPVGVADLQPLGEQAQAPARAAVQQVDGRLELRLQDVRLADADGYYEVWLLDRDVSRLVSLGPLRADHRYAVPAGVTLEELPVVDVSVEPLDGDPTHSGDSVLRGELRPA